MSVEMEIDIELLAEDTNFVKKIFNESLSFLQIKSFGKKKVVQTIREKAVPTTIRYIAELDNNTTAICRQLGKGGGTTWAIDDPSVRVPPLHWNCRSHLSYEGGMML